MGRHVCASLLHQQLRPDAWHCCPAAAAAALDSDQAVTMTTALISVACVLILMPASVACQFVASHAGTAARLRKEHWEAETAGPAKSCHSADCQLPQVLQSVATTDASHQEAVHHMHLQFASGLQARRTTPSCLLLVCTSYNTNMPSTLWLWLLLHLLLQGPAGRVRTRRALQDSQRQGSLLEGQEQQVGAGHRQFAEKSHRDSRRCRLHWLA